MTEFEAQARYGSIPVSDFLELIALCDDDSVYAAFFLIRYRLIDKFKGIYFKKRIQKSFEDTLEDFFLYFRDGKSGNNRVPFQSVRSVQNASSFQSWLLTMFSNYMTDQVDAENRAREEKEEMAGQGYHAGGEYDRESDSQIQTLGTFIAHFDATSNATDRLILYRYLIKKLFGASVLIPSHEFAPILNLTASAYRKKTEHMHKAFLAQLAEMQRGASNIVLDEAQQELAERIDREFVVFRNIIDELYDKAIAEAGCKEALAEIRRRHDQERIEEKKIKKANRRKQSSKNAQPEDFGKLCQLDYDAQPIPVTLRSFTLFEPSAPEQYSPELQITFHGAEGRTKALEKIKAAIGYMIAES